MDFKIIIMTLLANLGNGGLIEGFSGYGFYGLCIIGLGLFTVWSEKRRDERDVKNREQVDRQFNLIVDQLNQRNDEYASLVEKITSNKEDLV